MFTLTVFLALSSFWLLYATSEKVTHVGASAALFWFRYRRPARYLAVLLMLAGAIWAVRSFGVAVGLLLYAMTLIAAGTYLILLVPLGIGRWYHAVLLLFGCWIFETFVA